MVIRGCLERSNWASDDSGEFCILGWRKFEESFGGRNQYDHCDVWIVLNDIPNYAHLPLQILRPYFSYPRHSCAARWRRVELRGQISDKDQMQRAQVHWIASDYISYRFRMTCPSDSQR